MKPLSEEDELNIRKMLDQLMDEVKEGALILVEGIKDVECLRRLGIARGVASLNRYRSLLEFGMKNRSRRVILLPDFDSEGREILKRMFKELHSVTKEVDLEYHRRLSFVRRLGVREIQDLCPFLARRSASH